MSRSTTIDNLAAEAEFNLRQTKRNARKMAAQRRESAFSERKCEQACKILVEYVQGIPDLEIISAYLPIKTEICPLNAMHEFFRRGKRICLPVVVGSGQPLQFREWNPGTEMGSGEYGTSYPARGKRLFPNLFVVPLLAFDRLGNRLGYGGGFYDRTFAEIESNKRVHKVGLAFAEQECLEVPNSERDYRLDTIVTQSGVIRANEHRQEARSELERKN